MCLNHYLIYNDKYFDVKQYSMTRFEMSKTIACMFTLVRARYSHKFALSVQNCLLVPVCNARESLFTLLLPLQMHHSLRPYHTHTSLPEENANKSQIEKCCNFSFRSRGRINQAHTVVWFMSECMNLSCANKFITKLQIHWMLH